MWPRPPRAYPPVREREDLWRIAQSLPQMPGDSTVERIFTRYDTGYCLVLLLLDAPASVADLRRFRDKLVRSGWSDKSFTGGRYHFDRSGWVLTVKPGPLAAGAELRICRNRKPLAVSRVAEGSPHTLWAGIQPFRGVWGNLQGLSTINGKFCAPPTRPWRAKLSVYGLTNTLDRAQGTIPRVPHVSFRRTMVRDIC